MEIKLDPMFSFVTKEGKFDQRKALIDAGVKAAVCFRDGEITPELIRTSETDEQLIKRGLNTILMDHNTPTEHPVVGLEITGLPKIMCMVLNNEHQYTTCERSLRYTTLKSCPEVSELEISLYEKWISKFEEILGSEYGDFFKKFNKDEKAAASAMKKLAQETARCMVTVFMPTTMTYTAPWAQINKLAVYMERMINESNNTQFQSLIVPYLKEFVEQLKNLDVLLTNAQAKKLCPDLKVNDDEEPIYKNNKNLNLSLFADKNRFSGINLPNQFGVNFSYNFYTSYICLAQFHRHRTMDFEMFLEEDNFQFFMPYLLNGKPELQAEWASDMNKVKQYYPLGQLVRVNVSGSLKNLINFVGKERACDRAQLETQDMFTNQMVPDYYEGLVSSNQEELAETLKPYVKKLRCQFPDYRCPNGCGHPRLKRDF